MTTAVDHILRMSPDRLVHKVAQHMHAKRPGAVKCHNIETRNSTHFTHCSGDLLMAIPATQIFLVARNLRSWLAANRDGLCQRVKAITGETGIAVTMSGACERVVINHLKSFSTSAQTSHRPESSSEKATRRYQQRDEHESFFRPGSIRSTR